MRGLLLLVLLAACQSSPHEGLRSAAGARKIHAAWDRQVVYQIMVDRFFDGDRGNDQEVTGKHDAWMGGDLAGVIAKLDYLQGLGFTTLLLSPVTASARYHGYSVTDLGAVEPALGDLASLRRLVDEAHRRGMKVIFDLVLNHVDASAPVVKAHPDWFRKPWMARGGNAPYVPSVSTTVSFYELVDYDHDRPEVFEYLWQATRPWIDTGIDGFRMDAVTLVPASFWKRFNRKIAAYARPDFLILGECFATLPRVIAPYAPHFDALLDFPTYTALTHVVTGDAFPEELILTQALDPVLGNDQLLHFTFLDNHDVSRVRSLRAGVPMSPLLTQLFTGRGIPTLLYGTEVPLDNDPELAGSLFDAGRTPMDWSRAPAWGGAISRLIALRRELDWNHAERVDFPLGDHVLAVLARDQGTVMVALMNFASEPQPVALDTRALPGLPASGRVEPLFVPSMLARQPTWTDNLLSLELPGGGVLVARLVP